VAINLFGSEKRMAIALGRHPAEIGEEMFRAAESLMPPTLGAFWRHRSCWGGPLKWHLGSFLTGL
jgi:3-polyprenyl-4-hydroxybenzoate decarboxylase